MIRKYKMQHYTQVLLSASKTRTAYRLCLLAVLFIFLLVHPAIGQINATAQFDSNLVETGEVFALKVAVPKDAGKPQQIDFQLWEQDSVHLQSQSGWKPEGDTYTNHFNLLTFDADTLMLAPLMVAWNNGVSASTDSLLLMVMATPSPDDINETEDIKDIYREPANWSDYLPWFLIIGGLLLLALLAAWLLRQKPKKSALVGNRVIELPPHELALKKLDTLSSKKLWQQGAIKQYYAELTYIIREYLEKKYHVPALESVSAEILSDINRTTFPTDFHSTLSELFQQADLAKFAKGMPPENYHERALEEVRSIVKATQQQ